VVTLQNAGNGIEILGTTPLLLQSMSAMPVATQVATDLELEDNRENNEYY